MNKLLKDTRGGILIILAPFLFVLVVFIALAVDFGRAQTLRTRMQSQVDSAALAVGLAYNKNPGISNSDLKGLAHSYFEAGFPKDYLNLKSSSQSGIPDLQVDIDSNGHIKLTADADMPIYFTTPYTANKVHITTESTILHNVIVPTEIVLALDITGSMGVSLKAGDAPKYKGLYDAANSFLDIFSTKNENNNIFIGIVPYTQTVNIGVNGVASFPLNGIFSNPSWNAGNAWMDSGDPSNNYDWGDQAGTGYTETDPNDASKMPQPVADWNRIGSSKPYGWGGCVMARRPDINGTDSHLPLDISDDAPSVAPFQRFYYPSDNWNQVFPNTTGGGNSHNAPADVGCGFKKKYLAGISPIVHQDAFDEPAHTDSAYDTQAYTDPAYTDPAYDETICQPGEGGCTVIHHPAVNHPAEFHPAEHHDAVYHPALHHPARDTGGDEIYDNYNSFKGYNPWMCKSTAAEGNSGKSYVISRITNNQDIYYKYNGYLENSSFNNTTGPNYGCPLTSDRLPFSIYPFEPATDSGLRKTVENIKKIDKKNEFTSDTTYSNGTTINIGLAWAWRLMSTRWDKLWNDAIDSNPDLQWRNSKKKPASLRKFVVIMTDGKNNTTNSNQSEDYVNLFGVNSYTAYGLTSPFGINPPQAPTRPSEITPNPVTALDLDQKTRDLCHAMGSDGITIYTVGFGTVATNPYTDVNDVLLKDCAAYTGGKFYLATDNASLVTAFQEIANNILNSLRVTN